MPQEQLNTHQKALNVSGDVIERIADCVPAWERMVPDAACELIKNKGFVGYAGAPRG